MGKRKSTGKPQDRRVLRRWNFSVSNLYSAIIIMVLTALLLSLPHFLRYMENSTLPGAIAYYNARMASYFVEEGKIEYDPLSYSGRHYFFDPYHVLLAQAAKAVGVEPASRFLPYLLGIFSSLLFYLILRQLGVNQKAALAAGLIFIASPVFIDAHTFSKSTSFALFVFLLAFYLFMQSSLIMMAASLPLFMSMPLFGFAHALTSLAAGWVYCIKFRKMQRLAFVMLPSMLFSIIYLLPIYLQYPSATPGFVRLNFLSSFVAGLGLTSGISIFVIILFFISLTNNWNIGQMWPIYLASIAMLTGQFITADFAIYNAMIFSVFAAYAFLQLHNSSWEIRLIKKMTVLVLVCGILFSTISSVSSIASQHPDGSMKDALVWLGKYDAEQSAFLKDPVLSHKTVLSHYDNGFWIEYWAGLPVFMDPLFRYVPDADGRYNITSEIFNSRDLAKTISTLKVYNMGYIFIDPEMRDGKVWGKKDQGLLLLLKDRRSFRNIYNKDGYEIWQVIP